VWWRADDGVLVDSSSSSTAGRDPRDVVTRHRREPALACWATQDLVLQ
jgi:hypothetical protein